MDLPQDIALYLLLVLAVGAGYWLGRKDRNRPRPQQAVIKDYYQGLNFLLGDKPEIGVDRFIDAMEVSDATIDVHLAMAGVLRRRGEMDKAIRIHQNLLASPMLTATNKQLVEMELSLVHYNFIQNMMIEYHSYSNRDYIVNLLKEMDYLVSVKERDILFENRDHANGHIFATLTNQSD